MQEPFQCLQESYGVLIAARGSSIDSFSLRDGSRLATWPWPCSSITDANVKTLEVKNSEEPLVQKLESFPDLAAQSPSPAKRRKLSNNVDGSEANVEAVGSNEGLRKQNGNKGKQYFAPQPTSGASNVISLVVTTDGKYVIAVTGEDKTIRVYQHDGVGNLMQLSQRPMPKRPCAIGLTSDETTIVCADKFGDVYSLPLLIFGTATEEMDTIEPPTSKFSGSVTQVFFKPAANDLTVHSVRNRRALQNQLRQDQKRPRKKESHCEQRLLLGHVSMLTDVSLVEYDGRNYIISADRDEHIRISRGIPQTHVIEGYCLGHSDFVSRLCVPDTRRDLLISGGGDDELFVWDWLFGRCLHKVYLRGYVEDLMSDIHTKQSENESTDDEPPESINIAVSSIKHLSVDSNVNEDLFVVTCEGVPAIFVFKLCTNSSLSHFQTLRLEGNPLSVTIISSTNALIVSVDTVHDRGSTFSMGSAKSHAKALQMWRMEETSWVLQPLVFQNESFGLGQEGEKTLSELSSLLYSIENLRKRSGED